MNHHMKTLFARFGAMRGFLILFITQSLSALGSSMTSFALIVWAYQQEGSALASALLSVCSYAPYVLMSIFAGALSDRWDKRRVLLVCDALAAVTTLVIAVLLHLGRLEVWHLYVLNALNGLMNTIQQPAGDVSITLLTPREEYQFASSLRSLGNAINSMLAPAMATALFTLMGIGAVIAFDLMTFACAFLSLLLLIRIPDAPAEQREKEPVLRMAGEGLRYLRENPGIFHLMLFLAAINFTASAFNAALPALILPRPNGGTRALGLIQSVTGASMIIGSLIAGLWPKPKSRVRMICNTLLLSMCTENLILSLGRSVPVWCVGAVLGWIAIPLMNANLDVVMRSHIPVQMQGRVFAARNSFQFFTIPIGYALGGWLVDRVFEPLMALAAQDGLLVRVFGYGKGSGAAFLFFFLWMIGVLTCFIFRGDPAIRSLEE